MTDYPDQAMPLLPSSVSLNPFSSEAQQDPYAVYARLRKEDPVYWSDELGFWLISSYDAVVLALRHPLFSRDTERPRDPSRPLTALHKTVGNMFLYTDPPRHTRLRGLVNKAFTPRIVEQLRSRIQAVTDDLLDAVAPRGRMDVIRDFSFPLPAIVIAEMLGVPPKDRERFKSWSSALAAIQDPWPTPSAISQANSALIDASAYVKALIRTRRVRGGDDLLSGLIAAEENGDVLSEDELIATCVLILTAGHETTMNLIGNGLLALLQNPHEFDRLRADPTLVPSAVEEFLRYEAPVQLTGRRALDDFKLAGRQIRAGDSAVLIIGSANRDPARFEEPDQLNITRQDNRHLSFGHGIHFCLGAPLARAEAQIAFLTLLTRFPSMTFASEPYVRAPLSLVRGLSSFPVELTP